MQSTLHFQPTIASFQIAAQSAWSTLQILDRQARKDVGKTARFAYRVYRLLSSPNAIKTYKMVWCGMQIVCMAAIALGATARDYWNRFSDWADGYVDSCLEQEVEAAAPIQQAESATVADLESNVEEPIAPAQQPSFASLDPFQLRKECAARGIQWRNVHGKNKHLRKDEMLAALSAC